MAIKIGTDTLSMEQGHTAYNVVFYKELFKVPWKGKSRAILDKLTLPIAPIIHMKTIFFR